MSEKKQKNRTRKRRLVVDVSHEEYNAIEQRMVLAGTETFSIYARKMLLTGAIVKTDFSDLRSLTTAIGKIGNNINQIAYRANSSKYVKDEDIKNTIKLQNEIKNMLYKAIDKIK